jgi:hypothetical protein
VRIVGDKESAGLDEVVVHGDVSEDIVEMTTEDQVDFS